MGNKILCIALSADLSPLTATAKKKNFLAKVCTQLPVDEILKFIALDLSMSGLHKVLVLDPLPAVSLPHPPADYSFPNRQLPHWSTVMTPYLALVPT